MAVRTSAVTTETVKSRHRASWLFATKAWRLGFVALLGVGLWLGLRWITGAPLAQQASLSTFMADGGGGAIDVRGVYATAEYFRLTERDPATLGLNPEREQIFFVIAETHEHDFDLPSPDTWWGGVSLSIDGQGDYYPMKQKAVLTSEHHQTVAVAFQPKGGNGDLLSLPDKGVLALAVPNFGDGARLMKWHLPLYTDPSQRQGSSPFLLSLWAFLPLMGGLLVVFSPCFIHMGAYYAPLFGALQEKKLAGKVMKVRAAWGAGLFALGFTIPYALAGIAVGYAGQFAKNAPLLGAISQPVTFVAGAVVIYFGLQVAGIFQLPFLLRLKLPTVRPGLSGFRYLSSVLLGLNLAVGCLGCVGGSLFAGILLYSGAVGSPLEGGVTLFLFGLAANAPFFLAAMTLGRFQRWSVPLRVTRYIPLASGVILITLGLLILSGTESVVEDALLQAMGITG